MYKLQIWVLEKTELLCFDFNSYFLFNLSNSSPKVKKKLLEKNQCLPESNCSKIEFVCLDQRIGGGGDIQDQM